MPVHLSGTVTCKTPDERCAVETHLPDHIRLSLAEPGCLSFSVTQSADPNIWIVRETFTDRQAFDAHQTRTKASAWYFATKDIPRAYTVQED